MTKKVKNKEESSQKLENGIIDFPSIRGGLSNMLTEEEFRKSYIPLEMMNDNIDEGIDPILIKSVEFESIQKGGSTFSKKKPIYLQIHAGNIYSIFGSGIIVPTNYNQNRPFSDVQTLVDNGLILSNGFIANIEEFFILIELTFSENELNEIIIQDGIGYFHKPLPISRIKRIYVSNEKVKTNIITTAISNDGGIIPKSLIKIGFPSNLIINEYQNPNYELRKNDYYLELKLFDKILGSLAFLKNYSLLLANKINYITPIPEQFFYALQSLNGNIEFQHIRNERITSFYKQLFGIQKSIENPLLKWLFERVNNDQNFTDEDIYEFGLILFKEAKSSDFVQESREILQGLSKGIERKSAINKISYLNEPDKFSLYLFSFLRAYGNLNSENKTIFRSDIIDYNLQSYTEYIFALLGYFYGYKTLRNFDDKILMEDRSFSDYKGDMLRVPIKFEMETLFDFIVIESIYSAAFHKSNLNIDTSFIESDSIKKELIVKPKTITKDYTFKFDVIFGKFIYYYKKESTGNDWNSKLSMLPNEIPVISEIGIYCYRNDVPKNYLNLGEILLSPKRISYFLFFKKDDIISALKKNKINSKELLQRLEVSNHYKEF